MKTRLFNEDGGETMTDLGRYYSQRVETALREIFHSAIGANVSIKDLATIIVDETGAISAEERIRAGIKERAARRKKKGELSQPNSTTNVN